MLADLIVEVIEKDEGEEILVLKEETSGGDKGGRGTEGGSAGEGKGGRRRALPILFGHAPLLRRPPSELIGDRAHVEEEF